MSFDEVFLPVLGFDGKYEISNFGRVRGPRGLRKFQKLPNGYYVVYFNVKRRTIIKLVHRLVAEVFVPGQTSERNEVNHIDGNKNNNHVSNLEWCTRTENARHAVAMGLADSKGTRHWACVLNEDKVRQIRVALSAGRTLQSIANEFGTKYQNIWCIKKGISWAWLK